MIRKNKRLITIVIIIVFLGSILAMGIISAVGAAA